MERQILSKVRSSGAAKAGKALVRREVSGEGRMGCVDAKESMARD